MQKYSTYKPTNVEWLGDVPTHWKVTRLINRTESVVGGDWGEDPESEKEELVLLPVIRVEDIENEYEISDQNFTYRKLKESKIDHRLISNKTLLIEKSGGGEKQLVGRVAIPKKITMPAICSNFMEKIEMDEQAEPRFFNYIFHALYNQKMNFPFVQQTTGIQNLKSTYYFYTNVAYPKRKEQLEIAAYLDQATANIDKVIASKQQQLEKLEQYKKSKIHECVTSGLDENVKLKPSGIDWLGDIPSHWRTKRIKDISNLQSGDNITSEEISETDGYPVYGGNGLRGYYTEFTHEGFYALIGRQGALCGNINYADGKFWASEHAVVVTIFEGSDMFWLGELMREMNLNQYSQGSAQPGLAVEKIRNLKIPYPPRQEQREISDYLKNLNENILKVKNSIEQQIEKLKLYRKCLIHECVTGKRKVTDD